MDLHVRFAFSGEHDMNRWNDVLHASAALHEALATVEEPSWMRSSSACYQRCDRFAWDEGQPPGIIDFTPYWRPALYASAIMIVDAISVREASNDLIDNFLERKDGQQMLLRAALFRAGTYGQQQFYDYYFAGYRQFTHALFDRLEDIDSHCL
jgi:hypothetical protein